MSQRLSLVVQVCTLAACAALVFVAWQMQEGQRTQQEAFLAALAKLTEPRETKPAAPPETRLAVQLKVGAPGQGLPEQAKVRINGTHLSNNTVKDEKYFDPETGLVDFGRIPPGAYFLNVQTQIGFATRQIEVAEGESRVEEFTAPGPEEPVALELEIRPPAAIPTQDWKNADLVAFATFERLPITSGSTKWTMSSGTRQLVIGDTIERSPASLEIISRLHDPNDRFQFLVSMSRDQARLQERQPATSPFTMPSGARYRLVALGVIANPDRFEMGRSGGDPYFPPVAVIWNASHPEFPAWAKAEGNFFVVGNDESPPFNQQMFPWRIDIPEAMAKEVLAQIKQNAEFAAAKDAQEREIAEQYARSMAAKERASRGPTQNRVRIRFVEGKKDGPAVLPVYLSLSAKGTAKPLSPVLDENGWADFGYLDAGLCTLQIMLASQASAVRQFLVHPQKDYEEVIVCPPPPEPVSRRKFVVPLSEALKDKGIVASINWEWKSANAEKWSGWEFAAVRPFAKPADDISDSDQRLWINETFLNTADETTVVGEFATRPILIRPKSVQLNWPRPNEPGVSVVLGRAQFTDQPWLDLATANDDPITIGLPPDLLTKAEDELRKFTPTTNSEAVFPKQKRVRLRFVEGKPDGPAVRPRIVTLTSAVAEETLAVLCDEAGWGECGNLDAGVYQLQIFMPSGAATSHIFSVPPKEDHIEEIVCPPEPGAVVHRKFVVPLPDPLRRVGVRVTLSFDASTAAPEAWPKWDLRHVAPFDYASDSNDESRRARESSVLELMERSTSGVAANIKTRPIRIQPSSVIIQLAEKNQPDKPTVFVREQLTNQPWIDIAETGEEPIIIALPTDLLEKAEAELMKLNVRAPDEATTPVAR